MNKYVQIAKKYFGFEQAAELKIASLEFLPEVRAMCSENRCGSYGKRWTCPPGCGTLQQISDKAKVYKHGILIQTVKTLEDEFDWETMMETEKLQKKRMEQFVGFMQSQCRQCLPMSSGTCCICEECTYPDRPCRFPDKAWSSMEAYGLLVQDVCIRSGLNYYYGKQMISYTGCVLYKE